MKSIPFWYLVGTKTEQLSMDVPHPLCTAPAGFYNTVGIIVNIFDRTLSPPSFLPILLFSVFSNDVDEITLSSSGRVGYGFTHAGPIPSPESGRLAIGRIHG